MNLNEICLLKFLTDPDELRDLTAFFLNNINEFDIIPQISDN